MSAFGHRAEMSPSAPKLGKKRASFGQSKSKRDSRGGKRSSPVARFASGEQELTVLLRAAPGVSSAGKRGRGGKS